MKKYFSYSAKQINLDAGLLMLRIMIGLLMAFYGYDKITHFEELASSDFWKTQVRFLGQTGMFPLALTIFAELFCSLFLIVGLFTRLCLLPLIFCMAFIVVVISKFSILEMGNNGYEFNTAFVYLIIYLALFFTGPGTYSLDARFSKKYAR